jgi:hypothetical protein
MRRERCVAHQGAFVAPARESPSSPGASRRPQADEPPRARSSPIPCAPSLARRPACGRGYLDRVFQEPDSAAAIALLDAWLVWARRCRIPSFVKLAKTINQHYQGIVATLTHRLSNARTEAINTTLRLICRRAYGFHTAQALIALALLTLGGLRPPLPGRPPNPRIR